ncbi:hypothetical protein [Melghirimyces algeriensis]|nr:hypothetical protein [Melghirimyces algeriensis]
MEHPFPTTQWNSFRSKPFSGLLPLCHERRHSVLNGAFFVMIAREMAIN